MSADSSLIKLGLKQGAPKETGLRGFFSDTKPAWEVHRSTMKLVKEVFLAALVTTRPLHRGLDKQILVFSYPGYYRAVLSNTNHMWLLNPSGTGEFILHIKSQICMCVYIYLLHFFVESICINIVISTSRNILNWHFENIELKKIIKIYFSFKNCYKKLKSLKQSVLQIFKFTSFSLVYIIFLLDATAPDQWK